MHPETGCPMLCDFRILGIRVVGRGDFPPTGCNREEISREEMREFSPRTSVRRDVSLGSVFFAAFHHTIRGQASIANFVEQRAIADAQSPRRLFAVPVAILQNFQDDLALQLAYGLAGELLQRDLAIDWEIRVEEIGIPRRQITRDDFLVAQDYVTLDQIFQFAYVARPMILSQLRHQFI